jgi:hypothetical protein
LRSSVKIANSKSALKSWWGCSVLSFEILAQAASIQVISIIHRIKVRNTEVANSAQVANLNASVEHTSRPAGAAPVYVRVSGWFQGDLLCDPSRGGYHRRSNCRFLRTSENSRYAKFARISGTSPKRPGNSPIGRVKQELALHLCATVRLTGTVL